MAFTENLIQAVKETTVLEWVAVLTGITYVALAAYEKILCWFFGLISSVIYVYLCFTAQLYIETGLQLFYVIMSVYGWMTWKTAVGSTLKIATRNAWFHIKILCLGLFLAFIIGFVFEQHTNQASAYLDASITVFSLVATFMTARKVLENWIYWIVVDFAAIFLYASRDLVLSALLYGIFTGMAIYALVQWTRQYHLQKNDPGHTDVIDSKSDFRV